MPDYVKSLLMVSAGAVVTWLVIGWTDKMDAGSQAEIRAIAAEEIKKHALTDNGKSVKAVLSEVNERTIRIEAAVQASAAD